MNEILKPPTTTPQPPTTPPNNNLEIRDNLAKLLSEGTVYYNEDGEICIGIPLPTNQELGLEPGLE